MVVPRGKFDLVIKLEVQLKFQLEPTLLQRSCGCRWVFQVVPESSEEESFLGRIQNYRLFTDQLFSLYRSTKVRMKIKTALDLLTALRARARRFSKKKWKRRLCTGCQLFTYSLFYLEFLNNNTVTTL